MAIDDALLAARATALVAAAETAGLMDADLLKLARSDLTPGEALADLQRRYAGAFRPAPTPDARTMTPAQVDALGRDMTTAARRGEEEAGMRRFWRDAKAKMPDLEIPPEYRE